MKLLKYIRLPLVLLITFVVLGISSETYVLNGGIRQQDIRSFTRTLHHKQKQIDKILSDVAIKLEGLDDESIDDIFEVLKNENELFEHKELTVLVTKNNELLYWSDHVVGFEKEISQANEGFVQLPNGWFVLTRVIKDDLIINGLVLIKYDYSIENEYLQNTFAKGFHLPDDFQIHFYETDQSYSIYDEQNRFLFSIEPSGVLPCIYSDLFIPVFFFCLALFSLFIILYRINTHYFHKYTELKLILLLGFLLGIYSIMNVFGLPHSVYMLNLFSPNHFAYSSYWTSLGEFLVFTVMVLFWGINFIRSFNISDKIKRNKTKRRLSLFIWLTQVGVLFVLIRFMMHTLIMNSSISFAVYRIEEISFNSFLGFISIGFILMGFFFFALRTTQVFRKFTSQKEFLVILTLTTLALTLFFRWIDSGESLRLSLFYWIIMSVGFFVVKKGVLQHRLSVIVLYVFIFTFFTLFNLIGFQEKHENSIQEITAINLSGEHDPTAELYLRDIDYQIKTDTFLQQNLYPPYNFIEEYLSQKYFGGYLREYDLQFTLCHAGDSVIIQPENKLAECFPFFEQLLGKNGSEIPGINFHFLDNMNGRITYFGKYNFDFETNQPSITLYIELNSKLLSEGKGFPELLLPQHSFDNRMRNNFSFAKYSKGELVDRGGEFLYALTPQAYQLSNDELSFKKWDDYEHCIYTLNEDSFIIVSRPYIHISDYFIAFPYIFVFLFLLSLIVSYATRPYFKITKISRSLRMRVQISIIGVVLVTLLIIGSGTIYYIIAQYRTNHRQDLIDKINSVSVEVDMVMDEIEELNNETIEYLSYELVRISDIFWTDINIYDLSGTLIVSSRPEVFDKGLISEQMDNTAIYYLNKYQPTRFLHKEHIAKMEYLSAYVPLLNYAGKNIGYINLPYFTKEREFRQEITTFILAFINIYVFLLLASILVAYFISTRITDPLKLIRENLRSMQLGKSTQPIIYTSDDEIGDLVSEYNNKVAELATSADLIARSERETAWREMAKQIAHEIKNPLTPMKLNIQFLQRSKPSESDYNEKLTRVTETLIEQIDNLSAIATEFSNFAKIPKAQNEEFYLAERLNETLKLYNYTGQVEITTRFEGHENLLVYADKEQFSRAIINLVKNAIQAIPKDRRGRINIKLQKEGETSIIKINDNGKGIPSELKESIFVPNFTTKSSGAGLGLAITRNIVENFGGKIWFDSMYGRGTTFYIQIPLIPE
ncbi:MAG: HAMP domain-containing sensor histidine kinase [Prolixibacteraceae bacterium]|jgi:two-component system nitrogen regulation sensor histidine kinase NtrY|nr:HAMP domain-containing sensor histidine kinase [Prolixibacteraceae bacterium]